MQPTLAEIDKLNSFFPVRLTHGGVRGTRGTRGTARDGGTMSLACCAATGQGSHDPVARIQVAAQILRLPVPWANCSARALGKPADVGGLLAE